MKKTLLPSKNGFTIVEILVVITILAILIAGISFYGNSSVKNSRISTVTSFLQVLGSDIETAYEDYGPCTLDAGLTAEQREDKIKTYCRKLALDYLHTDFDYDSLRIANKGFFIKTVELDPWNQPYEIYYITEKDPVTNNDYAGNFVAYSYGPDAVPNAGNYQIGQFGDDLMLSVTFRQ